MTLPLPVPVLDHVVIGLRTQLDAGAERFRRLGFALTPRGVHTLGSVNHLAVFATDYLELLAVPPGETRRPEILAAPLGLNAMVFATEDADRVHAALVAAGLPAGQVEQFSRPVALEAGPTRAAIFRTVRLPADLVAAGRLYFCQHLTRDLVWRDAWRRHPNAAAGIARIVIAAADPAPLCALFARMFGTGAVRTDAAGGTLALGLARCEIRTPDALRDEFGAAAPALDGRPGGLTEAMAVLGLRSLDPDRTQAALTAGGIPYRRDADRLVVPAAEACGVTLAFTP